MTKDPRLLIALDHLRRSLGGSSFEIEDHWEADLLATGVKNPANPNVLAYLAVTDAGKFFVAVEVATQNNSDTTGTFECDSAEDVCSVIRDRLGFRS